MRMKCWLIFSSLRGVPLRIVFVHLAALRLACRFRACSIVSTKRKKSLSLHTSPFQQTFQLNSSFNLTFWEIASIREKKKREKRERERKKAFTYSKGKKKKAARKKRKEKMFHVEQFWECEKLGKTNKLKVSRSKKNIRKLLDNLKKRVLRKGSLPEVKSN